MAKKERIIPLNSIGGKIRARRNELGLTKAQLYDEALGDNRTSDDNKEKKVDKWEFNSNIHVDELQGICTALKVDADYLLGRIDERSHEIHEICEITGLCSEAIEVLHTLKDNKADFNICLINEILTGVYNSEEYKQLQAQRSNQEPLSDLEQMPVSIFDYIYQFLHCGGAKLYHKEKGQYRESSAFNEAVFRVPVTYNVDTKGSASAAYGVNDMFFELSNASDLYKTHLANKIMQMLENMKADNEKLK